MILFLGCSIFLMGQHGDRKEFVKHEIMNDIETIQGVILEKDMEYKHYSKNRTYFMVEINDTRHKVKVPTKQYNTLDEGDIVTLYYYDNECAIDEKELIEKVAGKTLYYLSELSMFLTLFMVVVILIDIKEREEVKRKDELKSEEEGKV